MKVVNQVLQTNDYTKFKILKGNRFVNQLHVKRLKDSFSKDYLMSPIIVNQYYEIIDGQHRFKAAKELDLPINYIIVNNYSLKEVQILNTNMKNWKKEDYLKTYCDLGYPEYLKFRKFMRQYPDFGIASSEAILTNHLSSGRNRKSPEYKSKTNKEGSYYVRYFEEGKLLIPDYQTSIDNAEKIMMIKPYFPEFANRTFVAAMLGIFRIKEYNHAKFLKKLKSNPSALQPCRNVSQYKLLIEDIYNYRSRDGKISLRF